MATKLYRDAAFADERSTALRVGVSVLVEGNRVVWIRPTDGEEEVGSEVEVVDVDGPRVSGHQTAGWQAKRVTLASLLCALAGWAAKVSALHDLSTGSRLR